MLKCGKAKFWLAIFCCVFLSSVMFSHGKKDVENIDVETPENWQEIFDLNKKKKGTYNILVTAKDMGGNTFIEGPYNIKVDPKSDLPVCSITNPVKDMRINANLNIVGACVDDDAVEHVELILDDDKANPVRATGAEFWSYYLDTSELEEGMHTIEVYAFDINGLKGNSVKTTWQLDRRLPVTEVQNFSMGELVSGKVNFKGFVTDGNGVKSLSYSVDNGQYFRDVKLKAKKDVKYFTIPLDTKKEILDGPAVMWFKATDNAGSVGLYAFLYFVDNTKPDVQIFTPEEKVPQYGKVAVAGIAKDTIGVTKLTWSFGKDLKGDIELVPGNPYWSVVLDTRKMKESARKFIITATDRAGNVVTVSRNIMLNQSLDKPTVEIAYPTAETYIGTGDKCFVRGIAKDKEGIKAVKYKLDAGEWVTEETKSVFYGELMNGADLSAGRHSITVVAIDKNDTESNPVTISFSAQGAKPSFSEPKISGGKNPRTAISGTTVHPEEGASFQITATSSLGLKSVHAEIRWGKNGVKEFDFTPNGSSSQNITIPINNDGPKGVAKISISATDTTDRTTGFKTILYITNTSVVNGNEGKVVFDDSTVLDDGTIIVNKEFPASGYFIGGNAKSAEIVPATPFAKAELHGNQIVLVPSGSIGSSEKVTVRVTTDQGLTYSSKQIVFKNDTVFPTVKIDNFSDSDAIDGSAGPVTITGSITCESGIGKVGYRIFSSKAVLTNGVVSSMENVSKSGLTEIASSRSFSIPINPANLGYGIFFVEVVAESPGGNKAGNAVCIRNMPELTALPNGKMPMPKAPMILWADGEDVYFGAAYQGDLDRTFGAFRRAEMNYGPNELSATVNPGAKPVMSKYTATKLQQIKAAIVSINGNNYMSGMPVEVAQGGSATLVAYIDTAATISSVNYEVTGDDTPGGSNHSGQAKAEKLSLDGERWQVQIPLSGLPARMNKIKIAVKGSTVACDLVGSFAVVRPLDKDKTDDSRTIYTMETNDGFYDADSGSYVLSAGDTFNFYANVPEVSDANILTPQDGLSLQKDGNNVAVKIEKDGTYRGIQVRVKDVNGVAYTSPAVNFMVDSAPPEVVISTPELHAWTKGSVRITGTAVDPSGVKNGEYSVDGGATWQPLSVSVTKGAQGATFSATADVSKAEDGLIPIDVRIYDSASHAAYARTAICKDTTPPEVELIMPRDDDVINGDNLLGFKVYDNADFEKAFYNAPAGAAVENKRVEIGDDNFVSAHIGTKERPIDDTMSVDFVDGAGNKTVLEAWKFIIDNQSDLPVTELHVPEENEVITKDFVISGVIYDDDGPSMVYYKIDDGQYKAVTDPVPENTPTTTDAEGKPIEPDQKRTSFSVPVDFTTLFDNEHTIYVYAVDTNGVKGPVVERKIRVSREEPKASIIGPSIDTTVREVIRITGMATDRNGIQKVQVSLDNGATYNDAEGQEQWMYTFDTRAIPSATNVVFIKVFDNYDIQGIYSGLINVDNVAPEMQLDYPLDYSATAGPVFFSGHAFDNIEVTELSLAVRSLQNRTIPVELKKVNFELERIIAKYVDLSSLDNGVYNMELTAVDKAGNQTHISRNIQVDKSKPLATVNTYYPLNGEHKQGVFNIYGDATADKPIESIKLYIDNTFINETQLSSTGYFKFNVTPENITPGSHTYYITAKVEGGQEIKSRRQTIEYSNVGPWVTIDNFNYGDFAIERPYIKGNAGYSLDENELLESKMKGAPKELKDLVAKKKVEKVEISFDNGRTFKKVSSGEKWRYRIENFDLPEGFHFMLVKATMRNGETAIDRAIIQIDNTAPTVRLIAPSMGGRYNQELLFSGLSSDDVDLKSVRLTLRKGDKASYQVPKFIQGLYVDWKFWGATLFDVGVGLTFFDDNVKLQFQWGQFTDSQRKMFTDTDKRYGGENVMGIKILANIVELPFAYMFGRDWEWLSATLAVGANFSYFDESASGKGQILSAFLAQLEFPRITFKKAKAFSRLALYTEFSLWFIPTDVESGGSVEIKNLVPQWSEGIRINIF